ncbi:MAG: lipopolysaccharide biosynthesis protein [Intrasporangium sp.]|uniref:lipopolysaccharide biosynthesis protein n=1 Tax=Intrasporangium sp. TaxID=1925024 RepID=UPI003F8142CE
MPADDGTPAAGSTATAGVPSTLRRGTIQVGVGLAFFGLSTYVFTAVVLRALGPGEFADFNFFWGLAYGVGLGAMMPFEQEISRRTVTATHLGEPTHQIVNAGVLASSCFSAALAVVVIPFALRSGHHDVGALWLATVASFVALGIAYVSRGSLAGRGNFRVYSGQLVAEGAVRLVAVGVLFVAGASAPSPFAVVVPVALLVAVGVTWRRDWRIARPPRGLARAVAGSTAPLIVSSMVSLTLVNLGPVAIRYVESVADPTRDGSYLAAAFIARLPIFVFAAVQAVLIPRLTRSVVRRDSLDFRRSLGKVLLVTVVLGSIATVGVAVTGPRLLSLLAGSQYHLPVGDMVLLTAALACYLLTLVLQPAAVALGRHRSTSVVWLLGAVTFGVAWFVPGTPTTAVSLAIGLVSLLVSAGLALTVSRGLRDLPRATP